MNVKNKNIATLNVKNKNIATQILKIAKRYCRYQDTSGLKQSRRVEGLLDTSVEEKGFKAIYVYLDIRIADRVEQICEILEYVDAKLPRQRPCYRHLFTFGWPDEKLHYTEKVKSSSYSVRKSGWRRLVGDIETSAIETATGIIQDLLPPRDPAKFPPIFRSPKKGDLFLWILTSEPDVKYVGPNTKAWSEANRSSVILMCDSESSWGVIDGKTFWREQEGKEQ